MRRYFYLTAFGVLVLLVHTVVHGWLTARWSQSEDLANCSTRLADFPETVGDWQLEKDLPFDEKHQKIAEVHSYVHRSYVHRRRGTVVSLLIVAGRPGPISVHTPDVCYRGAGYEPAANPERTRLDDLPVEFWSALFEQRGGTAAPLRILWCWNDGHGWQAPDQPRLAFGSARALYKLYVVRQKAPNEKPSDPDPSIDFLRALLPELDKRPSR